MKEITRHLSGIYSETFGILVTGLLCLPAFIAALFAVKYLWKLTVWIWTM